MIAVPLFKKIFWTLLLRQVLDLKNKNFCTWLFRTCSWAIRFAMSTWRKNGFFLNSTDRLKICYRKIFWFSVFKKRYLNKLTASTFSSFVGRSLRFFDIFLKFRWSIKWGWRSCKFPGSGILRRFFGPELGSIGSSSGIKGSSS